MAESVLALKTDAGLLESLRQSSKKKLTASEMLEQRVSFVYASVDARSGLTREKVRQQLIEQTGVAREGGA